MPTQRLDYDDPLCFEFDATVIAHGELGGARSVLLDRSAFYPESGGQMADRGTLGGVRVRDVQVDERGDVHHFLEGNVLLPIGVSVHGSIDAERRRIHMALHTAQHLFSRALFELGGAETTSSRLGESACTVDVDRPAISDALLADAESLVNALIEEDRPVRAWFPDPEELRTLPLRRPPKVEGGRVRVVDAGGFDCSPCGGTHVTHTAQIGVFRVLGSVRYKGGTRISFSAGARARRALLTESGQLRQIARLLTCSAAEVQAALQRLRDALDGTRQELDEVKTALARRIAASAIAGPGEEAIVAVVEEGGVELVRQVAAELTRAGDRLAIVAGPVEGGLHLVVARGPERVGTDARALFSAIAERVGGRGGGRPERAEGCLPAGADWRAAIDDALRGRSERCQ
jgi:alanyl-tRNA synthetase